MPKIYKSKQNLKVTVTFQKQCMEVPKGTICDFVKTKNRNYVLRKRPDGKEFSIPSFFINEFFTQVKGEV